MQADRCARGDGSNPFDFDGLTVAFLFSADGETTWFRDISHQLDRSRNVANCQALGRVAGRYSKSSEP